MEEEAAGGQGAIEVDVVINAEPAFTALDRLEERIRSVEQAASKLTDLQANLTVNIESNAPGGAENNERSAPLPAVPNQVAQAAAGRADLEVAPKLDSAFSERIREAIEAAFKEPIDVTFNIANLQKIRDDLSSITISVGGVPQGGGTAGGATGAGETSGTGGVGSEPIKWISDSASKHIEEILSTTHSSGKSGSGSGLQKQLLSIANTIREFSDYYRDVPMPQGQGINAIANVLTSVMPGVFGLEPNGRSLDELVAAVSPKYSNDERLAPHIKNALRTANLIGPNGGGGLMEIVRTFESEGIKPRGYSEPAVTQPEIRQEPVVEPAGAAQSAAEARPLPPAPRGDARINESYEDFARRVVESAYAAPEADRPPAHEFDKVRLNGPIDREQLFSLLSYKSGIGEIQNGRVVSRGISLKPFDEIPLASPGNEATFDAYIGGLRGQTPGLGPDAEAVFRALKSLAVVGKQTSKDGISKYFLPEPGSPDYQALEERMGRKGSGRFAYLSTGDRVEPASPTELLADWMQYASGEDPAQAIARLTQTPTNNGVGQSISSRIMRSQRNMSIASNRGKPSEDRGEATQENPGGRYLGPGTYESTGLEQQARLDYRLARVVNALSSLERIETDRGSLTPKQQRSRLMLENREQDLLQQGAQDPASIDDVRARIARAHAEYMESGPEGARLTPNARRIERMRVFEEEPKPDLVAAMQDRRVPDLWEFAKEIRSQVAAGERDQIQTTEYGVGRGPLLGGGPMSTVGTIRKKMADAIPVLKQMMTAKGASDEEMREALSVWRALREAMTEWAEGGTKPGTAMPANSSEGAFTNEGTWAEDAVRRSQSGTGRFREVVRRKPTPIDEMRMKLIRPNPLEAEDRTRLLGEQREMEARRAYGFEPNMEPYRNQNYPWAFEGKSQGEVSWQEREREAAGGAKRASSSPLLFPESLWTGNASQTISRSKIRSEAEKLLDRRVESGEETYSSKSEYEKALKEAERIVAESMAPAVGPAAQEKAGVARQEAGLRELQGRAKTIYRWAARREGFRKGGEWTTDLANRTRERIGSMELPSQGLMGGLLREEALGFSESRAPWQEDTLIPKGTGQEPASGNRVQQIHDANSFRTPERDEPLERGNWDALWEVMGLRKPIVTEGPDSNVPLRPDANGQGGRGGNGATSSIPGMPEGFGGSALPVHVVNFEELVGQIGGSSGGGGYREQAQNRFRSNRSDFRIQATDRVQDALRRDVDYMRGKGWTDEQIYKHAVRSGISGIEGVISSDSIGHGGVGRGSGLARRYLTYDEQQNPPSERYLDAASQLRISSGMLQQRSIPTYMISLAENMFGNRQQPIRDIIKAQRKLTEFGRVNAEYEDVSLARDKVKQGLDSNTDPMTGKQLTDKSRKKLEEDFSKLSKQAEELRVADEKLGTELNKLSKEAVGTSDVMRNLAAGSIGGVAGALAGQAISSIATAGMKLASAVFGPSIERGTGNTATSAKVQGAIGQAAAQTGGYASSGVASVMAQTGIASGIGSALYQVLDRRAQSSAASQKTAEQLELIRASSNMETENRKYFGYDRGLFDTTGGLFGTPINGQASSAEMLYDAMKPKLLEDNPLSKVPAINPVWSGPGGTLGGNAGGMTSWFQQMMFRVPGKQELSDADKTLQDFQEQVERGDGSLKLFVDSANKGSQANEDLAKNAEKFKKTGWAELIRKTGMTVEDGGANPFGALMQKYASGTQKLPAEMLMMGMESKLKAQRYASLAQLDLQRSTIIPQQWALQQTANPISGSSIGPTNVLAALGAGGLSVNSNAMAAVGAETQNVRTRAKQGRDEALDLAFKNLPLSDALKFRTALTDVQATADRIANTRMDTQLKQAKLAAAQFTESLRLAKQAKEDALGAANQAGGSELGQLQYADFQLGQRSARLGQALSQRQINFQVAMAGFSAPGMTPEERAARIQQAKIEAKYAQEQLDIQKRLTNNQAREYTITSARNVTLTTNQVNLMNQGKQTELDSAGNEALITALTASLQEPMQKVQAAWSTALEEENVQISTTATIIANTSDAFHDVTDAVTTMLPAIGKWASSLGIGTDQKPRIEKPVTNNFNLNVTGNQINSGEEFNKTIVNQVEKAFGNWAAMYGLRKVY